ncbi:MAG: hypothetical protein IJI92_03015 [Erysipelotrichaceae bacterium]|nr:hypothetical protein [Erysipelotrichaceae bacterium]
MDKRVLNEEELKLVSGGKLLDGWDDTLLNVMRLYKGKFGEDGYQMVRDMVIVAVNDPTSPVAAEDAETMYNFIDSNWDSVIPWVLS